MLKLLRNGLLFISSAILVYVVVFAILFAIAPGGIPLIYRTTPGNVWEGGGTYVKFRNFNKDAQWDVIIMGSSHAYRGYDPAIFEYRGLKTYNLGTSDQNMMCTYYIAKEYINSNNCSMVILDMYDRVFTQNSLESMSDVIHNVNSDRAAFNVAKSANDIRAVNMFTLRLFNKLRDPLNTDTTGFYNGYISSTDTLKLPGKARKWKYVRNDFQMEYLEKLLAYLQSQNIRVVMAEHPMPSVYAPKDHHLFVKDIQEIADKYKIPFYDYMEYEPLTGIQYFSDETHLNFNGVQSYNRLLLDTLNKDGNLPGKLLNESADNTRLKKLNHE